MIHKQMMNNNIFFFVLLNYLSINNYIIASWEQKKQRIEHNKSINLNVIDVCRPFWANQSHMNHMNFQCNRSTSALRTVWRLNCGRELPHQPHDKLAKNAQIKQMNDLLHFNTICLELRCSTAMIAILVCGKRQIYVTIMNNTWPSRLFDSRINKKQKIQRMEQCLTECY